MAGLGQAALQVAIFNALSADANLMAKVTAIYDAPPAGAIFPYVVMGDGTLKDASLKQSAGAEHKFQVDVWADDSGRMPVKEALDLIHTVLHDATLTLSADHLVMIRCESGFDKRVDDGTTVLYQGALVFKAIVRAA